MTKQVTLNDIYQVVNRLEDKMDERLTKVETRIDLLEDFKSRALGLMSLVTIASTAVFSWIWEKIVGKRV